MSAVGNYVALAEPRSLPLVLFSGLPALMMAGQGWPTPALTLWTLVGTIFAAAAANAGLVVVGDGLVPAAGSGC